MTLRVNGETIETGSNTVAGLLAERDISIDRRGIAVALNDEVVPRSAWKETPIREGDRVEVIAAMQGG
jgi:sulfur carrier protein